MTIKKKPVKKAKIGRPTRYKAEYGNMARVACKLGATDEDLAELLGVCDRTIQRWKKAHPEEFSQSIKKGKNEADQQVRDALFHRAKGATHKETKIVNGAEGHEQIVIDRHYPPDTAACVFWLCNRDGDNWKRNGIEDSGDEAAPPLNISFNVSPAQNEILITKGEGKGKGVKT